MNHLLLMPDAPTGTPPPLEPSGDGDMASQMVAEMTAASAPPAAAPAPAAPAAPTPAAKTPEPPKPAAQPPKAATPPAKPAVAPPAKVEPPKGPPAAKVTPPAADKPLDWKTAPEQFRTAHEKLLQTFEATKTELSTKLTTTEGRMRELEGKKFLSPEQEQKYAQLEKDQQALRAELYSRDYRESPEFKAKWEGRAKQVFTRIGNELKSIQVTDGEGNARVATMADFQKIQALGDSQVEQRRQAKAMFGEDADVVIAAARELQSIQQQANEEIEAKRNGFQSERDQQAQKFQQEGEQARQVFGEYDTLLTQKFPQYFAPIEGNEEYNKALDEGLKYVDSSSLSLNAKTPQERAQTTAMLRRWAGAFPAQQVMLKQLQAQNADLQAQIEKLRGTDPGELGGGGGGGGEQTEVGGTDAMTAEIEKLQRQA